MQVTSYVAHMCTYITIYAHKYMTYVAYGWHTYFWHMYDNNMWRRCYGWLHFSIHIERMLGLSTHIAWWQYDLYLQCDSHICTVIHDNYMKCSWWSMCTTLLVRLDASYLNMAHICFTYNPQICPWKIWHLCEMGGGHIFLAQHRVVLKEGKQKRLSTDKRLSDLDVWAV